MNRLLRSGLVAIGLIGPIGLGLSWNTAAGTPRRFENDEPPTPPLGLPPVFWPDDNPYSKAKAELGRLLYFDKRLSSDNSVSCASCHAPEHAFTDRSPVSTGIRGQKGARSAPTVINRAYSTAQFWDGRAASLEEQAIGPLANSIEMTHDQDAKLAHKNVVMRLGKVRGYAPLFKQAFGDETITLDRAAKAIATFERTVFSGDSPYDRYQNGDKSAMSADAVRGMDVFFNKAACDSCHLGFNFSDGSYMNIGIGMDKAKPDLGRYLVSGKEEDKGAFKTPTLREIEHTAPYMHDGRFKTLEEVVDYYDRGGIKNPYLSSRIKPLHLTDRQKKDLVAFLKSLSGEGWRNISPPGKFPD